MLDWLMPADCEGLHVCSACGDRETRGEVCWVCRQQEMIDGDLSSGSPVHLGEVQLPLPGFEDVEDVDNNS